MEFCATHSVDPYDTSTYFTPHLQIFGRRIHDGCLSTSHESVQSGSVSDALQDVGQAYKRMGAPDIQIANMICIGFFFLCQPGKHSLSTDNTPFCLQDVTLCQGADIMTYKSTGTVELDNATLVALTFTMQKNGVKGEIICNGMTGDPHTCPAWAVV